MWKDKSGKYFRIPYWQTKKNVFPDFSRLENDQTYFHTFADSVGTLCILYSAQGKNAAALYYSSVQRLKE